MLWLKATLYFINLISMKNKQPTVEEVQEDFDVYGIELSAKDVKKKCASLCAIHNLTPEQIAVHWLGFAASNSYDEVTLERLDIFDKELAKKKKVQAKEDCSPVKESHIPQKHLNTDDDDLLAAYGVSPIAAKVHNSSLTEKSDTQPAKRGFSFSQCSEDVKSRSLAPSLSQSPASQNSQRFSQRTNSGAVVATYGSEEPGYGPRTSYSPQVKQLPCGGENPLSEPYTFMYEKLRDTAQVLDDIIYHLGSDLEEVLALEETFHLKSVQNESVWFVGRVSCDSMGRLNAASVMLEGDREKSCGACVRLDVSGLQSFALFPGQIVAVKGINPTGGCLIANEIVCGKALPSRDMSAAFDNKERSPVKIALACGPFTTLDNLLYEPLMKLLEDIVRSPPHVLILMGPLVDSSHPALEDPLLADSYDSMFARCIKKIEDALTSTDTRIYLICCQRDICSYDIYPTPAKLLSNLGVDAYSKIKLLPDPTLLEIDGVVIGLTTVDYPMHMSREEISFCPQNGDRLARFSQHLLLQQSFYPIYPPPEGMNLHVEQLDNHARLPYTPHVMITPSDFKGYIKNVDGCVFINPERLTKGKAGGSHCQLLITPSKVGNQPNFFAQITKI